ncbi:MAG: heparinase II/III domain-containing protein [Limisphaerales bacterium]
MKPPLLLQATLLILGLASSDSIARAAETPVAVPVPSAATLLAHLQPGHPRLLMSAADFHGLKRQVTEHATLKKWHADLVTRGARILGEPASKYEIPDGLRLLSTSRRVLDRTYTLALLHRLDGDRRYVDRLWIELKAAAEFPDWNPRHFLDTAEMTHAFAIGYDWLYDAWTDEQRTLLRTAMVGKGIQLANDIQSQNTWWAKSRHNWNQVCNGGIGMGALALADVEPEISGRFLEAAMKSIQLAMREYGPDGAWAEGPAYWHYATSYNVVFLAALHSALGSDFGLGTIPGFREAGLFPIHLSGPLGRTFNYADGGDGAIRAPEMFWLAERFGLPAYAQYQMRSATPHPLDLVWFLRDTSAIQTAALPLDRHFRGAEVVTMRSAWDDRNALFVGFKGGDNQANHSNLDLGSFVMDAMGVRWVVDLGADNYNLPGYFSTRDRRWTYYRMRAEGHNALVINPDSEPDQALDAKARITRFESGPTAVRSVVDLTAAYARHARSVNRSVSLVERKTVLVEDDVELAQPGEVWWFLHTPAEVELSADGRIATLKQDGRQLLAKVLSPGAIRFAVLEARPLSTSPNPDGQNPNRGIRKLAIHLEGVSRIQLRVELQPLETGPVRAAEGQGRNRALP